MRLLISIIINNDNVCLVYQEKEKEEKAVEQASKNDDKAIRMLEKQLKMKKRKSKSLPQAFLDDGLDCILYSV